MGSRTTPSSTATTPECTTAIPGPYGYVPPSSCNALYLYNPSFTAAVAFAVLFGLLTIVHIFLAILHRKSFCWVIIMGAIWELASFILRTLGTRDQQNEAYATASTLLFLLAPLWINAFVYMTAGRLVYFLHPKKRLWGIEAVKMGRWFVWLDILSFIVQAAGGLMMNQENGAKIIEIGRNVYMSGVGVQQLFILIFLGMIVRFHVDLLSLERDGQLCDVNNRRRRAARWKWLTYTLYAVLGLITIRIVFRLVEFSAGIDESANALIGTEGYALGLDAIPMMLALLLLAIVHPGLVLKGPDSEFLSRKEKRLEKKARKARDKSPDAHIQPRGA
ncbi:hypothetical protein AA0111_g1145 [Alternaria arborescens]|uniref:hypothetical protein n=1 Tax=Alternaria arborescens TaxID=156630 RepID=UPI001075693B|nr:hypothetical protein AA0111_g1145 [Alternaria arborescens]RYO40838.1 hypothetical protein AA0111_g1145 [Alternaria arborescens]